MTHDLVRSVCRNRSGQVEANSEVMAPEIPKDNRRSFTKFRMTPFWGGKGRIYAEVPGLWAIRK
jgi:hypothetical protein